MFRLSSFLKNAHYHLCLLFIGAIAFAHQYKVSFSSDEWSKVVKVDGKGYYAYLPAVFVYQDLNFGFFEEVEIENAEDPNQIYWYIYNFEGSRTNKYFAGTALCISPFFLLAHAYSYLSGGEMSGFSFPYMFMLGMCALFYFLLGIHLLRKTLELSSVKPWLIVLTMLALAFSTNLYYYTVREFSMSHVYSFAWVSVFVFGVKSYFVKQNTKHLLLAALALGIVLLIRPVNGLIVFSIPFLAGSLESLKAGFKNYLSQKLVLISTILIPLFIASIQLVIYKVQTGKWLVYSYAEEGFNFTSPEIFNFLFSYKKGLFVYTPATFFIVLLVLVMLVFSFAKEKVSTRNEARFQSLSFLGFFLLIVYVLSSWWMWFYGGSFGSRAMIEYYPFIFLALALSLNLKSKWWLKVLFIAFILACIQLNMVQTKQYISGAIHWVDMDKEWYWRIFKLW